MQDLQQQLKALEVEKQIDKAQLETLTEYLIRSGRSAEGPQSAAALQLPSRGQLHDRHSVEHVRLFLAIALHCLTPALGSAFMFT